MNNLTLNNNFNLSNIDCHYKKVVKDFLSWQKENGYKTVFNNQMDMIKSISKQSNKFLNELKNSQKLTNNTLALKRIGLKKLIQESVNDKSNAVKELINQIFKTNVKSFKVSYSLRQEKYLKRHEIESLIEKATKKTSYIIKTLFYTGLRISELINIKLSDCEVFKDYVSIRIIGKGNKERFIKIPVSLFNELKLYFNGNVYLFETTGNKRYHPANVYKELKRQAKNILNKKVSPHMLRHSIADYLINIKKIGLPSVSKMLGHSSSKITADIYCHSVPEYNDLFNMHGELI